MSSRGIFDLARQRQCTGFSAKLLCCTATGDIKTVRKFTFYPIVKLRIRFDFELSNQCIGRGCGLNSIPRRTDMEVDQSPLEMVFLNPFMNGPIMAIWNQKRETETSQDAFGSPFPVLLLSPHLDQLTRKGHYILIDLEKTTKRLPNLDLTCVNIAFTLSETLDFSH